MSYPNHRYCHPLMKIKRNVRFPEDASGVLSALVGQEVDIRNKIGRGIVPSQHYIIEANKELGIRDGASLKNYLLIKDNRSVIKAGTPIAGKDAQRGRRVFAPADGLIVYVGEGRIIFQAVPEVIELEAGVRGTISEVYNGRSVTIETTGAFLQGVWGNGKNIISTLRLEPPKGVETMSPEALDSTYRNEIVVSSRPLTAKALDIAESRNFGAMIAPSAPFELIDRLLSVEFAVMLTEGFGDYRMNGVAQELLKEFESYQATLDAHFTRRWDTRRPELVINRTGAENTPAFDASIRFRKGQLVRIARDPYMGISAKIVELPKTPILLDNGLRVLCGMVELNTTGDIVPVPLANLEFFG